MKHKKIISIIAVVFIVFSLIDVFKPPLSKLSDEQIYNYFMIRGYHFDYKSKGSIGMDSFRKQIREVEEGGHHVTVVSVIQDMSASDEWFDSIVRNYRFYGRVYYFFTVKLKNIFFGYPDNY